MSPARGLLGPLFNGPSAERIFSPESQLNAMLRFELALAHALETAGVVPPGTGAACTDASLGFVNAASEEAIAQGAIASGNLAIPFVQRLTTFVRTRAGSPADFIHFGATSQDLLDTALVLQLLEFSALLQQQTGILCASLIHLTRKHRESLLPSRTWLQQGPPITFGLKTAQWLSAMLRHRERLTAATQRACVLQFGGAVGTLASLGAHGPAVAQALAAQLHLPLPDIPWHSERDTLAEFAAMLALLTGTLGKVARDLSLMLQNEVAEVQLAMPEGAGGSSTMPHKRNPVGLAVVLAAAVRAPGLASTMLSAMVQEHERGLGGWHAEWETLPELCRLTCGAAESMAATLAALRVDPKAMHRNFASLHGVTMAESVSMRLAQTLGRPAAHRLLEQASRAALEQSRDLEHILSDDPEVNRCLSPQALREALDPAAYLGSTQLLIDRVLATASTSPEDLHDLP